MVLYFRKPAAGRAMADPLARIPHVEGILTAEQVAETAASIAAMQEPSGAVPWTIGEHTDIWNHVEAAMAMLVGGQVEAAERCLRVGADAAARGRLVADEDRRRRGRGPPRRGQHVVLPRGRRLAPLADPSRHRVRAPLLAGGAGRARLGRLHAAVVRRHRLVRGVGGRPTGPARRARRCWPAPRASTSRCAAGVALADLRRRAAAGVGAGRRPARPRDPGAPRPVRGQVDLLDGLVLPGARRRGPRRRGLRAARDPLGRVRRRRASGSAASTPTPG